MRRCLDLAPESFYKFLCLSWANVMNPIIVSLPSIGGGEGGLER